MVTNNQPIDPFFDRDELLWSPSQHHNGFGRLNTHGREIHYSHVQLNDASEEEEETLLNLDRLDTPNSDVHNDEEARILRRVSRHLLARFFTLTLLCYIDRTNLSFAALQMNTSLGFDGYFVSQLPSNLVLQRVGAPLWLACIMVCWGTVALCFAFITSAWQFYVLRVALGIAEGGTFPGMWYHLSTFLPEKQLGLTYSFVLVAITVSQVLGAPLAALIYLLDGVGGLEGWQWLFILESIPTFALALWVWRTLSPCPSGCRFLTQSERAWLVDHCAARDSAKQSSGARGTLGGALLEARTWWMGGTGLMYTCAKYGVMYFCPLIIQSLLQGRAVGQGPAPAPQPPAPAGPPSPTPPQWPPHWLVALLSTLPYVVASITLVVTSWSAARTGEVKWHVVAPQLVSAAAFMMLPLLMRASVVLAMAGLMLSTVMMAGEAIWISWMAVFLHGPAAAAGVALVNSIGNLGGLLGSSLLGFLKTHVQGGYATSMPLLGTLTVLAACSNLLLHRSIFRAQPSQQAFMPVAQVCGVVLEHPCMYWLRAQECDDDDVFEQGEDTCLAMHAMEVEDGRSAEDSPGEGHTLLLKP